MATQLAVVPDQTPDRKGMSDNELAALLAAHMTQAVAYFANEIADEQADSLEYYYGRPFGDEQAGRSQVVDRTVQITVDNAVAALLRPFVSADEVAVFEPRNPGEEQAAQQATDWINFEFLTKHNGFLILHSWFKAACLEKLGIVKVFWQPSRRTTVTREEGLDAQQLEMLVQGQDETYRLIGGPYQDQDGLYACDILRIDDNSEIKIITVPSEEFLIAPFARDIETAEYCAHRPTNITRSDLIDMGFDPVVVDGLPAASQDVSFEQRSQARYNDEWFGSTRNAIGAGNDRSRDLISVLDEYVLVDYDGDGISERRRVIRVNQEILFNQEVEDNPFALLCPVPMPHKTYGLSLADQTRDLQRINSVVTRQTLDNLYLANNPKTEVPMAAAMTDGSTYDDLMDPSPGGIVRSLAGGMIREIAVPFVADKSFPMLQYFEAQQEARTGVSRGGQGIDADTLNGGRQVTATEIAEMMSGKNQRVEMIARIFAETGVKRLFRLMLRLMCEHMPRKQVMRLRNQWVEIDPQSWNAEMDVTISVGLGVGSKAEQIFQAQSVLDVMERLGATPFGPMLIQADNVYNAVKRFMVAGGIKNTDEYITEPQPGAQPPPQQNPEMMKAQTQAQIAVANQQLDSQKAAAQLQQSAQESEAKLALMHQESATKLQLQAQEAAAQAALAEQEMHAQIILRERQLELDHAHRSREAEMKHELAMEQAKNQGISTQRPGGALDK